MLGGYERGGGGGGAVRGYSDTVAKVKLNERSLGGESGGGRETRIGGHSHGWTLFERLYMSDGTLYIVTDDPSSIPPIRDMTSTGLHATVDAENKAAREPTSKEMQVISVAEAKERWGDRVWEMDGMTWLANDPAQFLGHFFHVAAELLLGFWRTQAILDPNGNQDMEVTGAPSPSRLWFLRLEPTQWRDNPQFNPHIIHSLSPSLPVLHSRDWSEYGSLTGPHKAILFPRAILADRSAANRGKLVSITSRFASPSTEIGTVGPYWWEPLRRQVLRVAGVEEEVIDLARAGAGEEKVVVSYVSRQGGGRRTLTEEKHEELVRNLREVCEKRGWELNVVRAERMGKDEQLAMAAKTTVIHGNGLTHLIWQAATPKAAVIEIFIPGGFARDYEWTGRTLGLRHYAVWNDTMHTYPSIPKTAYPPGYHGKDIVVHGPFVAELLEKHIDGLV
ncbi:hypothetical protein BDY24DRAFT_335711 [Mrakia frigida]|uniref:uncharacterized protein n=1 Tax=Mrakia frigida TaxID=29902 RepID=UPI003FCC0DC7